MKKLLRLNSGFTLVEVIAAAGIASVIGLIAYTNLQTSQEVGNKVLVDSEVNYLKNLIISTMGEPVACENTFKNSLLTLNSAVSIKDKNNNVIVNAGKTIGSYKKDLLTVTKVSSVAATNSKNNLIVTVDYTLNSKLGKLAAAKAKNAFDVNIKIMLDSTETKVQSCLVDTDLLLREAVKASCQNDEGGGAYYQSYESLATALPAGQQALYPYGKCTHDIAFIDPVTSVRTVLNNSAPATRVKTCPKGYFLSTVVTPTTGTNKGVTEYRCSRINTAPVCSAGEYLKTVSSSGVTTCVPFINTIAAVPVGEAIVLRSTGYEGVSLNCPSADPDKVLKRLNPSTGAPECIPKVILQTCPVGSFVSAVDSSGNVSCLAAPTGTSCGSGYVMAITSSGAVSCGDVTITSNCPSGIAAIDGSGVVTCR